MKTKLILGSLLAFSVIANAQQWLGSGINTGNIWRAGNVGIGNVAPATVLHVSSTGPTQFFVERTAGQINGLKVFFTSNPAIGIAIGAGSTIFQNQSNVSDMLFMHNQTTAGIILKSTGDVGIGSIAPVSKLYVVGTNVGVRGDATDANFAYATQGVANGVGGVGLAIGLTGLAGGGNNNYGAYLTGVGNNNGGGVQAYGVYAQVNNASAGDWAGYFAGNTFCTGAYLGSDRKLKTNILPFTNAMDKINQLKPSTYTFKTNEFRNMNLPQGNQIGLIAQELEEVFPELIQEVAAREIRDEKGEVTGTMPSFKSVNYTSLIPVLIAGMQEQQKQINAQKELISQLMKGGQTTGITDPGTAVSGVSLLDQNIPNPFTNETVINYTLPQQVQNAALVVYDLSGKQISSFALNNGGSSITLSSEKLAAGIYIYSVMADGKILDSKRMVVAGK